MNVKELHQKLTKIISEGKGSYEVGCEEDLHDGMGCMFKEYTACSVAEDYDGELVFIY